MPRTTARQSAGMPRLLSRLADRLASGRADGTTADVHAVSSGFAQGEALGPPPMKGSSMRQQRTSSSGRGRVVALLTGLFAVMALAVATPALANFSGAIYTTMADCTTVNGNIYEDKQDVYLNGGPQNSNASGLPANTVFYVKVTEPDGTLLSAVSTPDTITSDGDGNLPCTQLWGLLHKQSDGTQGYDTTTNNGSEYKVWISTERDFPHDDSKTDNFKVVVDEEPPPVPAADNLTVTKTADPTFDRSFTWSIDKSVDNTSLNGLFGTATFNYSVAVTKSAASDSGWKVTGTISVTNPNADPVTGVDVSDDIGNEAADTCVVTGGSNATIQAQSTSQFEYTCTYSAAPAAAAQTNTATAT